MTDPISDMLNRIKNAQGAEKQTLEIPFSNVKYEIAKILAKEGFIGKTETKGKKVKKVIEIELKYQDKVPVILGIKKISKPGQRIYLGHQEIKRVRDGYGMAVVSTSKGMMTDKEARKNKLGGEVICEIW